MSVTFDPASVPALRGKWGWFVALGVLLLICSFLAFANEFLATVVSVYYIGMLMLFGGIVHLVMPFSSRVGGIVSPGWRAVYSMRLPASSPSLIRCWFRWC